MLRLALIGCGRIAQLVHLRALASLPGIQLVAVADADPERLAEARGRALGATAFGDYGDLLARSDADAVVIALPPHMHAAAAVAAFEAGKHVFLEKPGAIDGAGIAQVTDAWREAGTVGMIGFNQRFHPMYGALRRALERERLGDVVGVRSVFCASPRGLPPWKQHRANGGGVVLDLAVHHIDLLRFVFREEVVEVSAHMRSLRSEDDAAAITLQLESGILASIFVSMTTAEQDRVEVLGTAGMLVADRYGTGRLEQLPRKRMRGRVARVRKLVSTVLNDARELVRPTGDRSHHRSLAAFCAAVRTGDTGGIPTPDDAYRSLAVALAAEQAAASGQAMAPDRAVGLPELPALFTGARR